MSKRILKHTAFWFFILLSLTVYFGINWGSYNLAFYFSSMLLPVVMGTTYFFNLVLVPRYFLTGKYWLFTLYFFYLLVVSLYLEMQVSLISFVIISNYDVEVMGMESRSILILGANLYLIVFLSSFIRLAIQFQRKTRELGKLEKEIEKNQKETIIIRADRKNNHILLDDLIYIESLDDYVRVVTTNGEITAREKISTLHKQLPGQFLRIHRSFVINKEKIESFDRTEVLIQDQYLPIGRTYKKSVMEKLS